MNLTIATQVSHRDSNPAAITFGEEDESKVPSSGRIIIELILPFVPHEDRYLFSKVNKLFEKVTLELNYLEKVEIRISSYNIHMETLDYFIDSADGVPFYSVLGLGSRSNEAFYIKARAIPESPHEFYKASLTPHFDYRGYRFDILPETWYRAALATVSGKYERNCIG